MRAGRQDEAARRGGHGPDEEDGLPADPVDDEPHPEEPGQLRGVSGAEREAEGTRAQTVSRVTEEGRHRREEARPRQRQAEARGVHGHEPPMGETAVRAFRGRGLDRAPARHGRERSPGEPAEEEHRTRAHEHPPPAHLARDPGSQRAPDREAQDRHALEQVRDAAPPRGRRGLEELREDREEGGRGADAHDEASQQEGDEPRRHPAGHHARHQERETQEDHPARAVARAHRARRIARPEAADRVQRVDEPGLERRQPPLVGEQRQERRHHPDGERREDVDDEEREQGSQHCPERQRDRAARRRRRGRGHQPGTWTNAGWPVRTAGRPASPARDARA